MEGTFYPDNDYRNYLMHFGVKGMKWGVRRYRNYDGAYTQAGLKRYGVTERRYDATADRAKRAKADYKSGKITKLEYNRAKNARREAERDLKKDYRRLRQDKLADQGRRLYTDGRRINSNVGDLGRIAFLTGIGANYAHNRGNYKAAKIIRRAGLGVGAAAMARNNYQNKRIRAYYGHGGNWSGWDTRNRKYYKEYGAPR